MRKLVEITHRDCLTRIVGDGCARKTIPIEVSIGIFFSVSSARSPVQRALVSEAPKSRTDERAKATEGTPSEPHGAATSPQSVVSLGGVRAVTAYLTKLSRVCVDQV